MRICSIQVVSSILYLRFFAVEHLLSGWTVWDKDVVEVEVASSVPGSVQAR
jgi:hypothetical protein